MEYSDICMCMDHQVSLTSEQKITELKVTDISTMDSLKESN